MNCVDWNVERINAGDLDQQIKRIVDGLPADIMRQWQPTANRSNEINDSIQHTHSEKEVYSESSEESDNEYEMTVRKVVKPQIRPQLAVEQLFAPTTRPISPNCFVPGFGTSEISDQEKLEKMGSPNYVSELTEEREKSQDPDYIPVLYDFDESDEEEDDPERNSGKSHAKGLKPRSKNVAKRKKVKKGSSYHRGQSSSTSRKNMSAPRKRKTLPCEFECPDCPYATRGERGFRKHRGVHRNPRSVYCKECRRPFTKNWDLQAHMSREHGPSSTTPGIFVSREHSNDSVTPVTDDSRERGVCGQPISAENEDFGEHLATQAEGVSCIDNAHVSNVCEPCNYSTEDDTEYFHHLKSFSHFCKENLFKKSQKREKICPNTKTTKTRGQPKPWDDSPSTPTKRRTMSSKSSHIEENTTHPEHEEKTEKLTPDARSVKVTQDTVHLVTNFTDFARRPYSCVLCFFRTGEPEALQKHCRNHLTGGKSEPEDDNIDHRDSCSQSPDFTPHTESPINFAPTPLTSMENGVPANTRSVQTNHSSRPYDIPSPSASPRLASSPTLINPWKADCNNSQPPYQETRTEDLIEQGKDYEKDPSNVQQYKCRYCPLRFNILRRLMRHFENCHKDILKAKALQARRYIEVINLT